MCEKAGLDTLDATNNPEFLDDQSQAVLEIGGKDAATDAVIAEGGTEEEVECGICCGSCDSQRYFLELDH